MLELFRFWRRVPRFAIGGAVLLLLGSSLLGREGMNQAVQQISVPEGLPLEGLVSVVLVLGFFIVMGSIGIFLMDFLIAGFAVLSRGVLGVLGGRPRFLKDLLVPISELVRRVYEEDRSAIERYFTHRTQGDPDNNRSCSVVKKHYKEAGHTLLSFSDSEAPKALAYWAVVSQEQAKLDNWELEVAEIQYFIIFVFVFVVFMYRFFWENVSWGWLVLLSLGGLVLALPMLAKRRRWAARGYLNAYFDSVLIAEGASIEDRGEAG